MRIFLSHNSKMDAHAQTDENEPPAMTPEERRARWREQYRANPEAARMRSRRSYDKNREALLARRQAKRDAVRAAEGRTKFIRRTPLLPRHHPETNSSSPDTSPTESTDGATSSRVTEARSATE